MFRLVVKVSFLRRRVALFFARIGALLSLLASFFPFLPMSSADPPPPESSEPTPTSALAESIAKKQGNSYYFAHANTPKERVVTTVGDAPRLISSAAAAAPPSSSGPSAPPSLPIDKYQWADDGSEVLLFIPWEGAEPLPAASATLTHGARWVRLELSPPAAAASAAGGAAAGGAPLARVLHLRGLSGAVAGARVKCGKARITVRLTKAEGDTATWYSLLKSGAGALDEE